MPVSQFSPCTAVLVFGTWFAVQVNSLVSPIRNIEPAVTVVDEIEAAGAPLQNAERYQLTDDVVDRMLSDEITAGYASYFAFEDILDSNERGDSATTPCKSFPGDSDWPTDDVWDTFNQLLGRALIPTKPLGAPCYDSEWGAKDEVECANIVSNATNTEFLITDPTANFWPIF